jgi:hypothetical protein
MQQVPILKLPEFALHLWMTWLYTGCLKKELYNGFPFSDVE